MKIYIYKLLMVIKRKVTIRELQRLEFYIGVRLQQEHGLHSSQKTSFKLYCVRWKLASFTIGKVCSDSNGMLERQHLQPAGTRRA